MGCRAVRMGPPGGVLPARPCQVCCKRHACMMHGRTALDEQGFICERQGWVGGVGGALGVGGWPRTGLLPRQWFSPQASLAAVELGAPRHLRANAACSLGILVFSFSFVGVRQGAAANVLPSPRPALRVAVKGKRLHVDCLHAFVLQDRQGRVCFC